MRFKNLIKKIIILRLVYLKTYIAIKSMFYPTKPGSEEFHDVSLSTKRLSYSIYNRLESYERRRLGKRPQKFFRIKLKNLDRFIKPQNDDFSVSGSDPPESLRSSMSVAA